MKIIYDPKDGITVPDCVIKPFVQRVIDNREESVSIGSWELVSEFLRHRKVGSLSELVIYSNGKAIPVDKNGTPKEYPPGSEVYTSILGELL